MKMDMQLTLTFVAMVGVLLNSIAIFLQWQRYRTGEVVKLAALATLMLGVLEVRLNSLEKGDAEKDKLFERQSEKIEYLINQIEERRIELKAAIMMIQGSQVET